MKTHTTAYQPKTGVACSCRKGQERDNCPHCEGTGQRIDFAAIRSRRLSPTGESETGTRGFLAPAHAFTD